MSRSLVFSSSDSRCTATRVAPVGPLRVIAAILSCAVVLGGERAERAGIEPCDSGGLKAWLRGALCSLSLGDRTSPSALSDGCSFSLGSLARLLPVDEAAFGCCCRVERRLAGLRVGTAPGRVVPFDDPASESREVLLEAVDGGAGLSGGLPAMLGRLLGAVKEGRDAAGGAEGAVAVEEGREGLVGDFVGDCSMSELVLALLLLHVL